MRALDEREKGLVRGVAEAHALGECCDRWTHVAALAGSLLFDEWKRTGWQATRLEAQQAALWELTWSGHLTVLSPQAKAQVKGALEMAFAQLRRVELQAQAEEAIAALEYLS